MRRQPPATPQQKRGKGRKGRARSYKGLMFTELNLSQVVALPAVTNGTVFAQPLEPAESKPSSRDPKKPLPPPAGRIGREELKIRVERAMKRNLPTDLHCINTAKEWAVIGGGPSINDEVDTIRKLKRAGVAIVSVNKSHDWLLEHGIVPWGHVLLDPKDWVADYVKRPRKDVRYFVASQCHDSVFESLKDYPVFLWHAGQDFTEDGVEEPDNYLREHWPNATWRTVPGATTVGLRTPMLGHWMPNGPDGFHMFGMDSSRMNGALHAYDKTEAKDAGQGRQSLFWKGREFRFLTNSHMAQQFMDFDKFMDNLGDHYKHGRLRKSFRMKFYGYGLLPFFAAMLKIHAEPFYNDDPSRVGGWVHLDSGLDNFRDVPLDFSQYNLENLSIA